MILENITELFVRDLHKLKEEIGLYKNEADLWKVEKEIKNSAGNLTLHLVGNLNHFIGALIGKSGYFREREAEFSKKNIPVSTLLTEIDMAIQVVESTLSNLREEDLQTPYPIEFLEKNRTFGEIFLILLTHLSYHLGQINYHRRLID